MSYFNKMRSISYTFGNEPYPTVIEDLSTYVDILDQIKDNVNFYNYYEILEGDRPDVLSQKIYGASDLHWTFFLLNDNLREQGWPLSILDLDRVIKHNFPDFVLTTTANLTGIFLPGQSIKGLSSGETAVIDRRRIGFGQLIINGNNKLFVPNETIISTVGTAVQNVQITGAVNEYNAIAYYINDNDEQVDIDPSVGESAIYTPVTYYEHYQKQNRELRRIKVIKPSAINNVLKIYYQALRA